MIKERTNKKQRYIDYDYENAFDIDCMNQSEAWIEMLLANGKVKSVYATKTIKAGTQMDVELYPEFRKRSNLPPRAKPVDKKKQDDLNDINARKKLKWLLNENFQTGLWFTPTYDDAHLPKSDEEAYNNMKNYIRRINYHRKKKGLGNAKYVYVTEYNPKDKIRYHHHVVMDNEMSMDEVERLWTCGSRNHIRPIVYDDEGISGMAYYISKEPKGSKRWKSSTNLKQPTIRKDHQTFTRKKVMQMVRHQDGIPEIMEKKYPLYRVKNIRVKYNEYNSMFYIAVEMKEKAPPGYKRKEQSHEKKYAQVQKKRLC